MKKILLALALLASVQIAGAQQVKSVNAARAGVDKALKTVSDAKKAANAANWTKLGQAYIDAYLAPQGNGWIGASEADLNLLMSQEKVLGTREEVLSGQNYLVKKYATADYYFNTAGQLAIIKVTEPVVPDALDKALEAYKKAYAVDVKAKKTKDIKAGIENVSNKYVNEAYDSYTLGDLAKASELFEKAARSSMEAPFAQLDTNSLYNAGFTAWMMGNNERAQGLFEESLAAGYFGEDGEIYAKLADVAEKLGDKEKSKDYLENGFTAFPHSQSILVGLINYYVSSGDNPGRIFELLNLAKENEPTNASLYYVEGNIHEKLGEEAEALAAYDKCAEINPNYEYGYIGKGILLYNKAVDLQEKASNEMDDAKYMVLVGQFEEALKGCIEPFETAFELSTDNDVKVSIAEYLKNACFRFRTDEAFMAKYEKYNKIVAESR